MLANKFNHTGQYWNDNDGEDDHGKVALDHGNITEIITCKNKCCYPGNTADDIITDEMPVGHAADTCHKRREGPDDGDKACNDDCLATVLLVELVRPVQVLFVEKTDMLFMEYFGPHKTPYPVIYRVAKNSGDWEEYAKPHNTEITSRREGTCREKKGVTGKKRCHHKPCFTKYDEKNDEVSPHAVRLDHLAQMHINMHDELKKKFDKLY